MRRREVLKHAGTLAAVTAFGVQRASAEQVSDVSGDLTVTIQLGGETFQYRQGDGRDLGDFKTSNFVQRCIRVDHPRNSLSVYFRPDRGSDRIEVVFELGRMWGAANAAAAHLGPYRAIIAKGERTLATVDVPQHWWFSRWRWCSKPRPVVRSVSDLIKAKLIPAYSSVVGERAKKPKLANAVYKAPMDNAGVTMVEGGTGDRYDIGPVTEAQGYYLATQDSVGLAALMAQAEASGSVPFHFRDERTSAPVSFLKHPAVSWYYLPQGKDWVRSSNTIRRSDGKTVCPWTFDAGHYPALSYVPYLLTDDPYFLEELQFEATEVLGWTSYDRGVQRKLVVSPGQTRTFAWSLRSIFQAARVSPDNPPSWLNSRAYWKQILQDNLSFFMGQYVRSPYKVVQNFSSATCVGLYAPWQEEFLAFILGWAVLMGFDDWRPAFEWKFKSTYARTNGKSGWPRQVCTPYHVIVSRNTKHTTPIPSTVPDSDVLENWGEVWQLYKATPSNRVPDTFTDAVSWQGPGGFDYPIYTRAVLALALALDVDRAKEPFAFVDNMMKLKRYMTYRWAVGAPS
jgi:hypothetical protein